MPRLNTKIANKTEKAEPVVGGNFEPLPPGKYIGTLTGVEVRQTNNGGTQWSAEFSDITDLTGESKPGRQWLNLDIPTGKDTPPPDYRPRDPKKNPVEAWATRERLAYGRLHAFYNALGFSTDSDTDEMLGERAVLIIGVATIQQGVRTGERTNRVNGIEPLPDDAPAQFDDGDNDDEF